MLTVPTLLTLFRIGLLPVMVIVQGLRLVRENASWT